MHAANENVRRAACNWQIVAHAATRWSVIITRIFVMSLWQWRLLSARYDRKFPERMKSGVSDVSRKWKTSVFHLLFFLELLPQLND